ncbi:putative late blight resistance proteinR1B-16 [Sesamum alatum]|uniref:Late blight resistance proteinR1B-16 n=1 Tax=Sesamum alatum TaxID=300844 RepID=A0AAE2CXX5_9LAMI|nr:putative late blight resistance proteinR1B-16 [Sesamum alatum]
MAYAAVVSLGQTLDHILHPDRHLIPHHKKRLESLREKLILLQEFLEKHQQQGEALESLEKRIRDTAYVVEDIIEFQIVMPSSSIFGCGMELRDAMALKLPYLGLEKFIREIDSIVEEAYNNSECCSDEEGMQITDSLPAIPSRRKTTLAENVYADPLIVHHFDARAWITVSQVYNVRDILLGVLDSLGKLNDQMLRQEDDGLKVKLHKTLCARRYLIVMDDLWSTNAWDNFKMFFPDNNNRSRIIVTTRIRTVASYVGSSIPLHHMNLLCDCESWKLLQEKVFGEGCCPRQLIGVGKEIAFGCQGLPLAIVVTAGLLSKVKRTPDEWKNVAEKLHLVTDEDNTCFEILSLSYNQLPQHLKACFLYMGVFPEDSKISASKVIKLWAAEGFLKQNSRKTLEEVAKEYILELAERNLISILSKRQESYYGRNQIISIHDLLRDLCIKEAQKEKFLHVMKRNDDHIRQGSISQRRLSLYPDIPVDDPFFQCLNIYAKFHHFPGFFLERLKHFFNSASSFVFARSLLYAGHHPIPSLRYYCFILLKVLDITQVQFFDFPMEILRLCNLRYLAFSYYGEVPESISDLWNLQTLIFSPLLKNFAPCPRPLPIAIWSMPRLRHLKFHVWYLSDFPSLLPGWKTRAFLENLQTLSEDRCQILKGLNYEIMLFVGPEWEPVEGEFGRLNFLYVDGSDLVHWEADSIHFPVLRHLIIENCCRLEAIPSGIGEISTLQSIELDRSSDSAVTSAEEILEEQQSMGNDSLRVHIYLVGTTFS